MLLALRRFIDQSIVRPDADRRIPASQSKHIPGMKFLLFAQVTPKEQFSPLYIQSTGE